MCPFDRLYKALNEKNENTTEDAMQLLNDVHQGNTEWSVVYNLTDFNAQFCINKDYDKVYDVNPE